MNRRRILAKSIRTVKKSMAKLLAGAVLVAGPCCADRSQADAGQKTDPLIGLIAMCPASAENMELTSSREQDCTDGTPVEVGKSIVLDGISLTGLPDGGVFITADEGRACHFLSNLENIHVETGGKSLDICFGSGDGRSLLARRGISHE